MCLSLRLGFSPGGTLGSSFRVPCDSGSPYGFSSREPETKTPSRLNTPHSKPLSLPPLKSKTPPWPVPDLRRSRYCAASDRKPHSSKGFLRVRGRVSPARGLGFGPAYGSGRGFRALRAWAGLWFRTKAHAGQGVGRIHVRAVRVSGSGFGCESCKQRILGPC